MVTVFQLLYTPYIYKTIVIVNITTDIFTHQADRLFVNNC